MQSAPQRSLCFSGNPAVRQFQSRLLCSPPPRPSLRSTSIPPFSARQGSALRPPIPMPPHSMSSNGARRSRRAWAGKPPSKSAISARVASICSAPTSSTRFPFLVTPRTRAQCSAKTRSARILPASPSWIWHAPRSGMVQSESLFDSAGFHLRRRRPQHGHRPGARNARLRACARVQAPGGDEVPVPCRILQRLEPGQSRHPGPLCEHAAIRHHHGSSHPGPSNPAWRPLIVLRFVILGRS